MVQVTFKGKTALIEQNNNGLFNLCDIHKIGGYEYKRRPSNWVLFTGVMVELEEQPTSKLIEEWDIIHEVRQDGNVTEAKYFTTKDNCLAYAGTISVLFKKVLLTAMS